jgi:hypothetical protein
MVLAACGTVDPGQNFQFAEVVYDQNFFYCKVEPMLMQEQCGAGPSGSNSGCHFDIAGFHLLDHPDHQPVPCNGLVPEQDKVTNEAQSNYQAAELQMSPDPERAPLLNRPTQRAAHPLKLFDANSPQADLIRQWATQYSSQ